MRPTTVRLDSEEIALLELIAEAEGCTVADELRQAVKVLIDTKRKSPGFRAAMEEARRRQQSMWEKLLEDVPAQATG